MPPLVGSRIRNLSLPLFGFSVIVFYSRLSFLKTNPAFEQTLLAIKSVHQVEATAAVSTVAIANENVRTVIAYNSAIQSSPTTKGNQSTTAAPCFRQCHHRINRIYYSMRWQNKAGLLDRYTIITNLVNLAGYLCAVLYIPSPPWLLAASKHNQNRRLHHDVAWTDFYNFTFLQNGSPSVMEVQRPYSLWNVTALSDNNYVTFTSHHANETISTFLTLEEFS